MAAPPQVQVRTSVLTLLLVSLVSALAVASVYEIAARRTRHRPQPCVDSQSQERDSAPDVKSPRQATRPVEDCESLRRRVSLLCPQETPKVTLSPAEVSQRDQESRVASDLSDWQNPGPHELTDMAKRCEVRIEMPAIAEDRPPVVSDEQVVGMALSGSERAVLQRTLDEMHAGLRQFAEAARRELPGTQGSEAPSSLEQILSDLQTRPEHGFDAARAQLAREKAGLTPRLPADAPQPPGERLLRLWAGMGDTFEQRLAAGLGKERARELRLASQAGWMNRFSLAGCPAEQ
jgi:hypothetical protein